MRNQYKADSKLEARIAFILMKAGVPGPEIDICLDWAFGTNALYVPIYPDWYDRWHKLHPEYPAKKNMSFVEWLYTIGFLFMRWQEYKRRDEKLFGKGKLN